MEDKINILLVDDQPSKLLTYEAALSELGENLLKARSGMEALEQLLKHDVAVVLMDVCMPGMDGLETAEMIRQHPRFENLPIIFVSGICVTEIDRLKGYQHGAVDYLPTPVSPELLRAKVRTFAELHRKTRQLEALNGKITTLQEEERRRIARDLHDSVGQLLAAISMNHTIVQSEGDRLSARAAKCVAENAGMVQEVSKQIRTISYLLHPPLLDEAGLAPALRCYIDGFARRSNIDVQLAISEDFGRFAPQVEISIFRIVQECLTNIHRHSGSQTAEIRVVREKTYLRVEIEDAGRGMSPQASGSGEAGVGLLGMRERLRVLGGSLDIRSRGKGTMLTAVIPVPQAEGLTDVPTTFISTVPNS